ncbi:hypothetical protein J8TS2_14600 [Lederbergia ruris]|uniref:histidine kinase n=1 Tax=Lederbergia ruris TaxID=217495 RepID=A0ABQ4KGP6_9BACI|nr:HAMP domain-containing sensor histidine kinase [Lederbergia ruris]GIN57141.1 hypothetical protein J8TS2_14600 [Lederbergia ruris]
MNKLNGEDLEKKWHYETGKLAPLDEGDVKKKLTKFQEKYPTSNVFWVDENGTLLFAYPEPVAVPKKWTSSDIVEFMKKSYDSDPFTTVAFLGDEKENGFVTFQIPRSEMDHTQEKLIDRYNYLYYGINIGLFFLFVFISWLFFSHIRKRLLRLGLAMEKEGIAGIPDKIKVKKRDEIGQLEQSFNRMIKRLGESQKQKDEEEELRKQLIASLSHDLRTPLTTLRGHLYTLKKEKLTDKGEESLQLMDRKITFLGQLIDNLLSYTLLTAGKYPYHPQKVDIIRSVRVIVASWYPTFEKKGFKIEIELPEDQHFEWYLDPSWLERVLDNLFQNILRHADSGKYIRIKSAKTEHGFQLMIEDRGPGMETSSNSKGLGIGMAIVTLMLQEMDLKLNVQSTDKGTRMTMTAAMDMKKQIPK